VSNTNLLHPPVFYCVWHFSAQTFVGSFKPPFEPTILFSACLKFFNFFFTPFPPFTCLIYPFSRYALPFSNLLVLVPPNPPHLQISSVRAAFSRGLFLGLGLFRECPFFLPPFPTRTHLSFSSPGPVFNPFFVGVHPCSPPVLFGFCSPCPPLVGLYFSILSSPFFPRSVGRPLSRLPFMSLFRLFLPIFVLFHPPSSIFLFSLDSFSFCLKVVLFFSSLTFFFCSICTTPGLLFFFIDICELLVHLWPCWTPSRL